MKSLKCLLLGSATVLVVATGVRAADMPQAEEVEYVKVCDTYGVGFWYIPGTDTCIKLGGYVRAQAYVHGSNIGEDNWGGNPFVIDSDRDDHDLDGDDFDDDFQNDTFNLYTRGLVNFDARTETAYGTLRSFVQIRGNAVDQDNPSVQLDLAFLQFAGFTAGLAPSFLDFATNAFFGDHIGDWNHDTPLFGYTYQMGGGVSFNIAIESADRADTTAADFTTFDGDFDDDGFIDYAHESFYAGDETRTDVPDLVAAVRVDQGWGEAMIGGVVREVKGRTRLGGLEGDEIEDEADPLDIAVDITDEEESFRDIGWAIVGGLKVNLPMIEKGDYVILRAGYGQGASRYVTNAFDLFSSDFTVDGRDTGFRATGRDSGIPEAVFSGDAVDGGVDFETTTAYSLYLGFTHFWTQEIRSNFTASIAGGDFEFDDTDWSVLTASANVIWSPVKNLDVGLEVLYSARDFDDRAASVITDDFENGGDDDAFGAIFRVQRNFGN